MSTGPEDACDSYYPPFDPFDRPLEERGHCQNCLHGPECHDELDVERPSRRTSAVPEGTCWSCYMGAEEFCSRAGRIQTGNCLVNLRLMLHERSPPGGDG